MKHCKRAACPFPTRTYRVVLIEQIFGDSGQQLVQAFVVCFGLGRHDLGMFLSPPVLMPVLVRLFFVALCLVASGAWCSDRGLLYGHLCRLRLHSLRPGEGLTVSMGSCVGRLEQTGNAPRSSSSPRRTPSSAPPLGPVEQDTEDNR